jgi:C-terminal processing protease CtpA/Prc
VASIVFVSAMLVACTEGAREDVQQAGRAIERSGEELGQAAQKSAEHVDERAEVVGRELSEELDTAREKLGRAKEVADRAGDLYMDPQHREEIDQAAVRCSAEQYAIDRAMVEKAIANPLAVAGATSFEPVAGKGYRLTRIDPDSPVAKLDVRVGDILVAVDGTAVNALVGNELVQQLRRESEMTFTVERGGEDIRKTVTIDG